MAKTVADVMNMVKESEVKFVDFRFTDTRGKEQHVTVPISAFNEDKFTGGHAFDGSSIAGWKGIEASDMQLMPDPNTANIDPFYEEPTLILTCDVVEPGDGKPYERDPRSLAKRAEAYMKASGLGDAAYFGPEPEFFIFDSVRWQVDMSGCFCKIESEEASWNSAKEYEHGNSGYRPDRQGRLLPDAADRFDAGHALGDVPDPRVAGHSGRGPPPRGGAGADGDRHQVLDAGAARRLAAAAEVRDPERRPLATARPRPSCPSRSSATTARACTCTSRSGRAARTCSPATATRASRSSRCSTSAGSSSTRAR